MQAHTTLLPLLPALLNQMVWALQTPLIELNWLLSQSPFFTATHIQNNTRRALSGFCTIHLKKFFLESEFSKHRDDILSSAGFPCSEGKAAGHGLPTTLVDTEVPKACLQAMAWSEAVEFTQAAQEATTVGLGNFSSCLAPRLALGELLDLPETLVAMYIGYLKNI